jgi:exodeoxyribonuclease-5
MTAPAEAAPAADSELRLPPPDTDPAVRDMLRGWGAWPVTLSRGQAERLRQLSAGQRDALGEIAAWHQDGGSVPLILGGLAGTGKTTVAGLLPAVLNRAKIAYTAYTGKAVHVLRGSLGGLGARAEVVSTLHRLLYRPAVMTLCAESGLELRGRETACDAHRLRKDMPGIRPPCPARQQVSFTPAPDPLAGLDLVVADEASMIPEQLWADLTGHGVPVLAIGDHGQLPPVQSAFSLMSSPDLRLEEIHRQSAADPDGMAILNMSRWAREHGYIPGGWYGPSCVKTTPDRMGHEGLHPGDANMILCATNATRAWHNDAMRAWHGRSGPPAPGDVVICLRNNYGEGLFNGQRGTVRENRGAACVNGTDAWQLAVDMDGQDLSWEGAVAAAPFGQLPEAARSIRDRSIALFDWGYALTTHKSQGSAADNVLVIEESWPPPGEIRSRWLYTAVTRAVKQLTVVGW